MIAAPIHLPAYATLSYNQSSVRVLEADRAVQHELTGEYEVRLVRPYKGCHITFGDASQGAAVAFNCQGEQRSK